MQPFHRGSSVREPDQASSHFLLQSRALPLGLHPGRGGDLLDARPCTDADPGIAHTGLIEKAVLLSILLVVATHGRSGVGLLHDPVVLSMVGPAKDLRPCTN